MSRAFVKEDASSEEVIIPARAPLPAGTPNHVTPRGMALLEAEFAELTADQARLQRGDEDEAQRARKLAAVGGRIDELRDRLASALLVDSSEAPAGEVRFGATVTVQTLSGKFAGEENRLTIVGVDEAEAAAGRGGVRGPDRPGPTGESGGRASDAQDRPERAVARGGGRLLRVLGRRLEGLQLHRDGALPQRAADIDLQPLASGGVGVVIVARARACARPGRARPYPRNPLLSAASSSPGKRPCSRT